VTALALHTALSIALIAWGYMIASRVPYRPALVWAGVAPLVLLGYLSLVARSVFDGSPAKVQTIVGNVAATLLTLAGIGCLVLFAAVSRMATRSVAARGAARADASAWAPRDEESVIMPEGTEDWDSGSVIDAGSSPSGPSVEEEPHPGRYEYAAPGKTDAPPSASAAPTVVSPQVVPSTVFVTTPARAVVPPPLVPSAVPVSTAPAPVVVPSPFVPSAVPVSTAPAPSPFAPPAAPLSAAPARAMVSPPLPPAPTAALASNAPARAMAEPAATGVYTPVAPPPVAASEWTQASSADEDPWEQQIAPRRALPPSDEDDH
jgi:hypothetical protein